MKKILFLILFIILFNSVNAESEVYDGNRVYVNNSLGYYEQYPHHITHSQFTYHKLYSKNYTGNITLLSCIDKENIEFPTLLWKDPEYINIIVAIIKSRYRRLYRIRSG